MLSPVTIYRPRAKTKRERVVHLSAQQVSVNHWKSFARMNPDIPLCKDVVGIKTRKLKKVLSKHTCIECGAVFRSPAGNAKYCPSEVTNCRKIGAQRRRDKWSVRDPMRGGAKPHPMRECPVCKKEFQPRMRHQKFCNDPCGHNALRAAQAKQLRDSMKHTCELCTRPFKPNKYAVKNAKYCGNPCNPPLVQLLDYWAELIVTGKTCRRRSSKL